MLNKKVKNNIKSEKAITLIALVITIIVLLILAGISISMLSGDNSILNKASQSNIEQRAGTIQEEKDLWTLSKTTDEYTSESGTESLDELLERLGPNNQKLLTTEEVEEIKTNGQVTIGSRTIVFEKENSLEIGDVVETTGLAIFKDSGNNNIEWIYFGKDSNGNNLVTTAKPLTNTFELNKQPSGASSDDKKANSAKNWLYYDLQEGDTGYTDTECTTENNINKFCAKLYTENGGTVGKARSITLEDINRVTEYTEPTFTPITFGTGTEEYNYYYPTFDAKNQDTNTSVNPKVFKYWKKVTETSEKIFTATEIHPPYSYDSSTCTNKNMKYVIGESNDYLYAVGSHSVIVDVGTADFYVARVRNGYIKSNATNFCISGPNGVVVSAGSLLSVRPIVSIGSEVKLNKVQ